MTVEGRKKAYDNLVEAGVDALVVIGGDGSFTGAEVFNNEYGFPVMGIPGTIDNDIFGTDYCLGVDTALNIIRGAIDSIRDTSASFRRACVVETMGRDCGYLAVVSAITSGAEVCIVPELAYDFALAIKLLFPISGYPKDLSFSTTSERSTVPSTSTIPVVLSICTDLTFPSWMMPILMLFAQPPHLRFST
jgi:6-phosphofructokinase